MGKNIECEISLKFTEDGPEYLKMKGQIDSIYGGLLFSICHAIETAGDDPEYIAKLFYQGIKDCTTLAKGLKVKFNGEDEIGWM